MKNLLFALSGIFILSGCEMPMLKGSECILSVSADRNLTQEELDFIPYQINDVVEFTNQHGETVQYVCDSRVHETNPPVPPTECSGNVEYVSVTIYDELRVNLKNNTVPGDYISLKIDMSGRRFFVHFPGSQYGNTVGGPFNIDSLCGPIDDGECLDSFTINNVNYQNVMKFAPDGLIDTLYYARNQGLIKYCLKSGEIWTVK